MSLNFSQKNAVELTNGPCLILAGAGSGKTKVIINKIIYLINHCQYEPDNIAAVTFTNKAAYEMRIRLSKYLNIPEIKKIIISTFHSLGLEIIKKEIDALELNNNFTLLDEKDQILLLKKICKKEIKNNIQLLKKLNFMISYWKNKFLTPLQVQLLAKSSQEKDFAYVYEQYTNYLYKANILDFDDLICMPTLLLKNNKKIKIRWQKKISYLLVDEYQDTNNSQYELIKMLANKNSDFTLVGDDDQSIYSWRGANPQNIFLLKKDFPNLKIIKMEHNYRSSGRILKAANSLIANNIHYLEKKLFSQLKYGNLIKVLIGKNEENEAQKIVKKIISQYAKKKIKYRDFAILYRGNYQSRILEKALIKENIPYNISEKSSFFSRPEIKDLLSYLRVVINRDDNHAFMRIVNIPSRQIGKTTLKKLEEWANKKHVSLFQASNNIEIKKFLNENTIKKIKNFISKIEKFTAWSCLKPSNIIDDIVDDLEYEKWLSKFLKDPNKIKNSINNVHTLSQWFKNMIKGDDFEKPMTLFQIVTRMTIRDILDDNIIKEQQDRVQLMTLHASKGLEFPAVFIIGMCEGILPNQKSIDNDNIEEERRLTYVGITRAKKQLFFTYCYKRTQYGQILDMLPSRFLFELPQEDLKWEKKIF
ncbi:DNA helicase Rep [Buchnera aphidicola str. APS (Acyrthosiphon pisum)]|uniref:ATP-dependent DNA helicase Rep n=2 Tax=Buchnera aphidicola TaxID=9 RepID=REP_BUCAI|nr:DNA helicase Rep [Buchnera aphidicola]P57654.1 RecName: Full=ATP-dependent DNA helicase Rep; AltName: Full=DNA 3'-5' helicase Rep [Buchnera aphidicola str. APS (Acyrthosiphon pisum)]pir/C84999/ ATP-dependent DNA helicase Rep [imported] - Buchnera sp. (strain APS) [Buchnera sp. (in: enterobacteria)]ADP66973.1 ATP-dependent DNA helicase Rep [Buchnera aphidicola str. TLW03 (Acyrthosiphon pisum)]ADP68042.1 ATP-dependent DNA helicase Rep [Buchnera aphidicola str. JF98 (Acyrthosiphon pisum)]ACL30